MTGTTVARASRVKVGLPKRKSILPRNECTARDRTQNPFLHSLQRIRLS